MERAVPALYRRDENGKIQEALLDVVVHPPASFECLAVDITIRCPHSERYTRADSIPSSAADDGEMEKAERYGSDVLPLSFETYGRMGVRSQKELRRIA
eukprot:2330121-Karenia_brevis.AAC.1